MRKLGPANPHRLGWIRNTVIVPGLLGFACLWTPLSLGRATEDPALPQVLPQLPKSSANSSSEPVCATEGAGNPTEPASSPVASKPAEASKAPQQPSVSVEPIPTRNLGECLTYALTHQPTVLAAQKSYAAAERAYQSLCNIHRFTTLLAPDIPIRRTQAELGTRVAAAELEKVHHEVTYDVIRLYWTYVYARQQETTANDVITLLEEVVKNAKQILEAGVPDPKGKLNQFTIYGLEDTIDEIRKKRIQAVTGQLLALAALKEVMGLDQCQEFRPRDTELPVMGGAIRKEDVIAFALARRPEIVQATAGLEAFRLEPLAQSKRRFGPQVATLASGSDIHSRPLPQPVRNGEYRPGAITPEMPTTLVGHRNDRVARASEYAARQEALYQKSLQLVQLEATNTYLQFEAAKERMKLTKHRYDEARKMVEQARLAAVASQDPELIFRSEALAGKAQAEYLEAVFEHIKVLTALERVTAGAIRPEFPGRQSGQ